MSEIEIDDVLEFAREMTRFSERVRNPDPANEHYVPFVEPFIPNIKTVRNVCSARGPEAVSGPLPIANDCSEMCRKLRDENNDLKAVLAELCRSYEHLEASKAAVDVNILIARRRV